MITLKTKKALKETSLLALLFLCSLLFFREILYSGKSLYGSDFILQFCAWKRFIYEEVWRNGTLPLWNPYLFSGTPFITNIQASMFYPLGFLYYLVTPEKAYIYSTVLHCLAGSLFMYLFMRSLSVNRAGSFFGSVVFSFNGYFLGHLYAGHLSFVQNYIWIPLIFLFLHRFCRSGNFSFAVISGMFLGVQILGGFPQIAFYTLLACTLFMLYHAYVHWEGEAYLVRLGTGFAICLVLGFCLAGVQILPTLEYTPLSTRGGGVSYAMATYESLHPKEILAFLVPDLYGNPVDKTYWRSQEVWHFWESCGYVGILPLFFLFVKNERPESGKISGFFYILAAFALFLALGKYNPLYPLIYRMPGFNSFRIPAQIIYLYVFSVAVLSGIGLGRIMEGPWCFSRVYRVYALAVGIVMVVAVVGIHLFSFKTSYFLFSHFAEGPVTHANLSLLYQRMSGSIDRACFFFFLSFFILLVVRRKRLSPRIFPFLGCGIVFLDLYLFGAQFVRTYEFVNPPEKKALIKELSKEPWAGRVVTMDSMFRENDGLMYRFPAVLGYDPLILKDYAEFVFSSQDLPPNDRVVNLGGIMVDPQTKLMKLLLVRQAVLQGRITNIHNDLPYAFVVGEAVTKEHHEVLPYMKSDAFDPRNTVVLEIKPQPGNGIGTEQGSRPPSSSCQVLSWKQGEIRLKVSSSRPGYLVLSEVFYPGWYAAVDGRRTRILKGDYIFRVVPLNSGEHEVRLYFVSWPFRIGALLSLFSLCAALYFIVMRKRQPFKT